MANDEVIKQQFQLIAEDPDLVRETVALPDNVFQECCFCIPALAEIGGTDPLRNDRAGFLFILNNGVTAGTLYLQKNDGSGFNDVATFSDDTYGTNYPFGFFSVDNNNYIGYLLEWKEVIDAFGVGTYRVRLEYTTILAATVEVTSFVYDLRPYSDIMADETVRLEFYNNRLIGNHENYTQAKNFGTLNWYNAIRYPKAMFGFESSEYETEEIRYSSGRLVDVQQDQTPNYTMDIGGLPAWLHRYTKTEVLQSDEILVTDYNSANQAGEFTQLPVKLNGSYEPTYAGTNPLTKVSIPFKLAVNNLRKKYC